MSTIVHEAPRRSLSGRLDDRLDHWMEPPNAAEDQQPDFGRFCQRFSQWAIRGTLATVTLFVIIFWPTDLIVFEEGSDLRRTFFIWRTAMVVLGVGAWFTLKWIEARAGNPLPVGIAAYYLMSFVTFYLMGSVDNTAFYLTAGTIIPPLSLGYMLPLAPRAALTFGAGATVASAYVLAQTGNWGGAFQWQVALVLLLASCAFSTLIGHLIFTLSRKTFVVTHVIRRLASTDALTGFKDRKSFHEEASRELLRARRYNHALGVMAIDIDHFAAINSQHDPATADRIFQAITREIRLNLRDCDLIGRLGGDDFAAMLPETTLEECAQAASRVRRAIAQADLTGWDVKPTITIGCTAICPEDAGLKAALERATDALKQAKSKGGDCVNALSP